MATYKLRHFSKVDLLKRVAPELLSEFLAPFQKIFRSRDVVLSSPDALDYPGLVGVFMTPDAESAPLAEALYIVDEMATADGMDALLAAAEDQGISLVGDQDPTPEEVALRVWLANRELVERKHAESFLGRVRSFEYSRPRSLPAPFRAPSETTLQELTHDLDDWFESKKRGRGSRVFIFEREDGVWILVRHGEPLRREGTMDEGERSIVVFRPEKFNVLVYLPTTGELGINAPSKGEKDLYRKKFGLHLFGDAEFFSAPGRYTLDPVRQDLDGSLVCSDVEGLDWVRLRELRFGWGGPAREVEIRQAEDLSQVYGETGRKMPRAPILQAKFEIKFTKAKAPRKLTIRPPSTTQYSRDSDKEILETWMRRRGFLRTSDDADA